MKSGVKPHLFTIISAIVVLAILSFIFLSYSTATIFNQAELAYLSGDWSTSVELFNKIRNRYPLSFPDRSEEVSYYLDGANMLIAAQEMETNKAYEEALSIYKDFLINHKDEYYHFSIS